MKIRSDQLDALQQQEEAKRKSKEAAPGFDKLLTQELGRQDGTQETQAAVPPPGARSMAMNPLLMTDAVQQTEAVQGAGEAPELVADKLEGMLTQWEDYSRMLAAPGGADLKGAYGTLDSIAGNLAQLKEQNPNLASTHPELGAVANELEVMSVTERFKINRGDYV